jgi:hypothetical protein
MQMEATVPLWRHCFRAATAAIFIFEHDLVWSGHPAPALAIELMLPFSPYGHPETTAGRHFDGGRTWMGLRRFDLGLILLVQLFSAFSMHCFGTEILKARFGTSADTIRRWTERVHCLCSLGSAVLYSYLALDLYLSGPSGWIWGLGEEECAAEFTMAVAVSMHGFYLASIIWDLVRTFVDKFGNIGEIGVEKYANVCLTRAAPTKLEKYIREVLKKDLTELKDRIRKDTGTGTELTLEVRGLPAEF